MMAVSERFYSQRLYTQYFEPYFSIDMLSKQAIGTWYMTMGVSKLKSSALTIKI